MHKINGDTCAQVSQMKQVQQLILKNLDLSICVSRTDPIEVNFRVWYYFFLDFQCAQDISFKFLMLYDQI